MTLKRFSLLSHIHEVEGHEPHCKPDEVSPDPREVLPHTLTRLKVMNLIVSL